MTAAPALICCRNVLKLCLKHYPRPDQIDNHPTNEPGKTPHCARSSSDSRSTAKQDNVCDRDKCRLTFISFGRHGGILFLVMKRRIIPQRNRARPPAHQASAYAAITQSGSSADVVRSFGHLACERVDRSQQRLGLFRTPAPKPLQRPETGASQ